MKNCAFVRSTFFTSQSYVIKTSRRLEMLRDFQRKSTFLRLCVVATQRLRARYEIAADYNCLTSSCTRLCCRFLTEGPTQHRVTRFDNGDRAKSVQDPTTSILHSGRLISTNWCSYVRIVSIIAVPLTYVVALIQSPLTFLIMPLAPPLRTRPMLVCRQHCANRPHIHAGP